MCCVTGWDIAGYWSFGSGEQGNIWPDCEGFRQRQPSKRGNYRKCLQTLKQPKKLLHFTKWGLLLVQLSIFTSERHSQTVMNHISSCFVKVFFIKLNFGLWTPELHLDQSEPRWPERQQPRFQFQRLRQHHPAERRRGRKAPAHAVCYGQRHREQFSRHLQVSSDGPDAFGMCKIISPSLCNKLKVGRLWEISGTW